MGRELQKKKRRSGIAKATQKPKSKKLILNNPIIAANWDRKQTMAQNYKRLGLASRLGRRKGGVEGKGVGVVRANESDEENEQEFFQRHDDGEWNGLNDDEANGSLGNAGPAVSEVKISRDATGRIVSFEGQDQDVSSAQSMEDPRKPMQDLLSPQDDEADDDETANNTQTLSQHAPGGHIGSRAAASSNSMLQTLSESASTKAAAVAGKAHRTQSVRERAWAKSLVEKYGEHDFEKMARDQKLNVRQQSVGDIRRRVEKYLESQDMH